jgi:patatin-related protein
MKEKELRLALVCYGGVSLVLYMQGVIKEFLKLTRASKAYHSIDDPERRQVETFATMSGNDGRERDTEATYFSLLQLVGRKLDLRIIVDSVAGASAGGISGIILARALAHDLSIDHLRNRWLEETDVLRLLAKSQRAHAWSKWFLYPLLWVLLRSRMFAPVTDRDVRRKLSTFFRSRWLEAPFDGDRFLELLFDGLSDMRSPGVASSSLLPPGHVLDLAVSVTDFFGYPRRVEINTPMVIQEREQSLLWTFNYCHWKDGRETSDFNDDNVPALALAARATSSFPGAFPPVQLTDIDRLLERRGLEWPSRSRFLNKTFREHIRAGIDPKKTSFMDGSIVNDKPFSAAINAIRERAAYRDVDRRLVYIDPDPEQASPPPDARAPSFLQTLGTAIFEIPLRGPIHEELARIAQFNGSIKRMRTVLMAARPESVRLVCEIIAASPRAAHIEQPVAQWRKTANQLAAKQAGYAYQVYARSKTILVLDRLIALICDLAELDPNSSVQPAMEMAIRAWADQRGALAPEGQLSITEEDDEEHSWIKFLRGYDLGYRHRRLSFVMRGINELYARLNEPEFREVTPQHLDNVKRQLQESLRRLRMLRSGEFASLTLRNHVGALLQRLPAPTWKRGTPAVSVPPATVDDVDDFMRRLSEELDLAAFDRSVDHIAGASTAGSLPPALGREVLVNYLGFSFWDVWTFPISEWHDLEEHREIRVDRISPIDATSLRSKEVTTRLKGAELRHFAGFLSRSVRENDYLWGRLHGAERLIDIVCDAATAESALDGVDIKKIKAAAFRSILDTEDRYLLDKALLLTVRKEIDELERR